MVLADETADIQKGGEQRWPSCLLDLYGVSYPAGDVGTKRCADTPLPLNRLGARTFKEQPDQLLTWNSISIFTEEGEGKRHPDRLFLHAEVATARQTEEW